MNRLFLAALIMFCYNINAQQQLPFEALTKLTGGTWQMKTKKGYICEQWNLKGEKELAGTGFSVSGKDTTIQERVKLVKNATDIYFVPLVTNQNGGKEVQFKLISATNQEYVFSNPAHDFPQRIVYKFISPDSLHAWVDGQHNGKFVKQDFYYSRVK